MVQADVVGMNPASSDTTPFPSQDWSNIENFLSEQLSTAAGLLGVALIEVDKSLQSEAVERLREHLDAEDHTARVGGNRFVIVRDPLIGPAEMTGLGLRIAESFPDPPPDDQKRATSTVYIGVVSGRSGDSAQTLVRHVQFSLNDAKTIGRAIIPIDDAPQTQAAT